MGWGDVGSPVPGRQDHPVTRRTLGTGPAASDPAGESTGARLLPVERLSNGPVAGEPLEGEQRPQEGVQGLGRRTLGMGAAGAVHPPGYGLPHDRRDSGAGAAGPALPAGGVRPGGPGIARHPAAGVLLEELPAEGV